METATAKSPTSSKFKFQKLLRTAACWAAGSLMIVGGLVNCALAGGWLNEQIGGVLTSAAGLCLLPPILRRIRQKSPWARRAWVPAAWFALVVVLMPPILTPLAPSTAEQARQRTAGLAAAERLMAQGDFSSARSKLFRIQRRSDPDGRVADLLLRIKQAEKAAAGASEQATQTTPAAVKAHGGTQNTGNEIGHADPAAMYVERVQTYWLPEVGALPSAAPADIAAYNEVVTRFQGLRANLADAAKLELTPAQRAVHERFARALAAKQRSLLPGLRRRYGELLDGQLFRSDIRVAVLGARAQTIRLTGPMFIRNANIEDMQTGLASDLARARFRRVEFRWSPRLDAGVHFDLNSLGDADVTTR